MWIAADRDDAEILDDIRQLADAARVPVRDVGRGKFDSQARCEAPRGVLALAAALPEADIDDLIAGKIPPAWPPAATPRSWSRSTA